MTRPRIATDPPAHTKRSWLDRPEGTEPPGAWESLPEWREPFAGNDHILLIAMTKGAKSTLAATITLRVRSLVAIDDKSRMVLPRARIVELPRYKPDDWTLQGAVARAIAWRNDHNGETNRVILRPHALDSDSFDAHEPIFRAIYLRGGPAVVWIDEITATGATATRAQPSLRALASRGRTRGIGLLVLSQAPYGDVPMTVRRNSRFTIFGPLEANDAERIPRAGIDLATTIAPGSGQFLLYESGNRSPFRLYLPIPPQLSRWSAP